MDRSPYRSKRRFRLFALRTELHKQAREQNKQKSSTPTWLLTDVHSSHGPPTSGIFTFEDPNANPTQGERLPGSRRKARLRPASNIAGRNYAKLITILGNAVSI